MKELFSKRSVRAFQPTAIEPDKIEIILTALGKKLLDLLPSLGFAVLSFIIGIAFSKFIIHLVKKVMNKRITHYDEKYMLRTIEDAYKSEEEEATGLAGELSAVVDSRKYVDGDELTAEDADLVERLNAAIPVEAIF